MAAAEKHSFIAAKITALIAPKVLQRWSNSLKQSNVPVRVNGIDPETRHLLKTSTGPDEHFECIRPDDYEIIDVSIYILASDILQL